MIKNGVWEVVRDEKGPVTNQDWYYEDVPPVYRNTKTEMYHYIGTRRRFADQKSLARTLTRPRRHHCRAELGAPGEGTRPGCQRSCQAQDPRPCHRRRRQDVVPGDRGEWKGGVVCA